MRIPALFLLLLLIFPFECIALNNQFTEANHGMVVTEQRVATEVGVSILRAGGNAIDAAVAVGYALAVVNPCCGNIGGGGFMTIHLADGKNIFLNFREKAPLNVNQAMYVNKNGEAIPNKTTNGYLAIAVPGTVLGLDTALKKFGTLTRQQVMAPAIRLAQRGYVVTATDAKWFSAYAADFKAQPNVSAIFLKKGKPYQAGEKLRQLDLANTLTLIAQKGPDAFYKGPIAKTIVEASNAHGGILSLNDFASYNVALQKPIYCTYHHYQIISAPPPSSGGVTLCEILGILENFPLKQQGLYSTQSIREIIEAMRYGFIDRNSKLGDPDFVENPTDELISKTYTKALSEKILAASTHPKSKIRSLPELTDTTHYSIVDNKGNAVAVTYTLNGFFGARIIAGNTGFFLNDEMDDFTVTAKTANKFGLVQSEKNIIQAGKRPLSSMTPTVILKNNQLYMVLGSPGGPRIISATLLAILNVIDGGMNLQQAVNKPRFHYQAIPDTVFTEPLVFSGIQIKKLESLGYSLTPQGTWAAVEAIQFDEKNKKLTGVNDRRRPSGASIGY